MRVKQVVSNSDFEAVCKEVLNIIKVQGLKGATPREIASKSALYRGLDKKAGEALLLTLECNEGIEFRQIAHVGGGRPRKAWVYPEDIE